MAKFGKDEHLIAKHSQGMEGAYFGATAAMCAARLVDDWGENPYFSPSFEQGFEEKMGIGFLHVAIKQGDSIVALASLGRTGDG
jgi:hypothetical protein